MYNPFSGKFPYEPKFRADSVKASGSEDEGYTVDIELEGFETAEEVVEFYNSVLKDHVDQGPDTRYGSTDFALDMLSDMDTSSVYRESEIYETEWAVDALGVLENFVDADEDERAYEDAITSLATITLASVSLSAGAEEGKGGYEFYRDIVENPGGESEETEVTGPIIIDVEEKPKSFEYEQLLEEEWVRIEEDEAETLEEDEMVERIHEDVLSGTIPEAKERIETSEGLDYDLLLETEKQGSDRVTLERYLEEIKEEEAEDELDDL